MALKYRKINQEKELKAHNRKMAKVQSIDQIMLYKKIALRDY
jgi:hypothetical protein